jgi:hypothetical protein
MAETNDFARYGLTEDQVSGAAPAASPLPSPPLSLENFDRWGLTADQVTPPDPVAALKEHIAKSPDPIAEQARVDASVAMSKILGLPPGEVFQNFDQVTEAWSGAPEKPVPFWARLSNTIKTEQVNREISKLSARQAVLFDNTPETQRAIDAAKADLPAPEETIKGLPGVLIQQLYTLGYEIPKAAVAGALADPKATAVEKVVAGIASVLALTPVGVVPIQGGRILKDINEQVIGTSYRVSIDAGMDPTVARVQAGVTAVIFGAMNTLQIGAAAGAAERMALTSVTKTLLSRSMIHLGLEATQQEAIAYGMTLANKIVDEAGREASNVWAQTELPHKDLLTILKEAGIEAQPMAIIGAGMAGAGIATQAFKIARGSPLEARVRAEAERIAEPPTVETVAPDVPPMSPEAKKAVWQARVDEAKARVAEITERLKTARPEERPVLEADLADHETIAATAFDVNLQWFSESPDDVSVGDAMRMSDPAELRRIHVEEAKQAVDFGDFVQMQEGMRAPDEPIQTSDYWKAVWDEGRRLSDFKPQDPEQFNKDFLKSFNDPEKMAQLVLDLRAHGEARKISTEMENLAYHHRGETTPRLSDSEMVRARSALKRNIDLVKEYQAASGDENMRAQVDYEHSLPPSELAKANEQVGRLTAENKALSGQLAGEINMEDVAKTAARNALARSAARREAGKMVNKMIRDIAGVDPSCLRDPYRENVQAIKDTFAEVRHTKKTLDRLAEIKKGLEENPDAEISASDLGRLADLGKTPLRDLSTDELRVVHDAVRMYAKLSREEHLIKVGAVAMAADKAVAGSLEEIPSAKVLAKRLVSSNPSLGEVAGDVGRWVRDRFGVDLLNFDLLAEVMGPTAHKTLFKAVHEGHVEAMRYDQERVADFAKDTQVLHQKYRDMSAWLNQRSVVGQVTTKAGAVLPLELTRGERMSLYMHAKNPQNAKHLLEGGFGFRWRKSARDEVYRIDAENLQKITDSVSGNSEENAYTIAADNLLRRTGRDLDSKFYELNDVHLGIVDNYYQLSTMPSARGKTAEGEMQFDIAKSNWARIGLFKGMTKTRVDSKIPIYLDPIAYSLNRSLEHAAAYIGLEEPLRNASRLLYYNRDGKSFRQEVAGRLGEEWWKDVEKGLKDIAGMRDEYGNLQDDAMKLRNNFAVATLGLNIPAMLRQTLGLMNYSAYVKPQYLIQGSGDCILHPVQTDKTHRIYSPEYVQRAAKGYSRETADVLKGGGYGSALGGAENIKARMMAGMQYFDRWTVKRGMQGAVRQVLAEFKDGALSPEVARALEVTDAQIPTLSAEDKMRLAYKYADYATERTQNSGLPEFQSTFQRGGGGEKFLTLFKSEAFASMNLRRRAYFEAKRTGSVTAWKRVAEISFVTVVMGSIGSMMINRARSLALGRKLEPIEKDVAYNVLNQAIGGLPVVGDVGTSVLRHAVLGYQGEAGDIVPLQRAVDVTVNTFNGMVDAANAETADRRNRALLKTADSAAEAVGLMAAIPYVPIKTIGQVVVRAVEAITK